MTMTKRVEYKTKEGFGHIDLPGDATEAKVTGFTTNEKPTPKKKTEEIQANEEAPMIPPVLEDVTPDVAGSVTAAKDKKVTDEDEDKLLPIIM